MASKKSLGYRINNMTLIVFALVPTLIFLYLKLSGLTDEWSYLLTSTIFAVILSTIVVWCLIVIAMALMDIANALNDSIYAIEVAQKPTNSQENIRKPPRQQIEVIDQAEEEPRQHPHRKTPLTAPLRKR